MLYTIKEIADLARVPTRTLRYYDEIGRLGPVKTGENGYGYYDQNRICCACSRSCSSGSSKSRSKISSSL